MAAVDTPTVTLPTLDRLGVSAVPKDVDAKKVAALWFDSLVQYIESKNIDGTLSLFHPDAWFRDMLALTWTFRTFQGASKIRKFLEDTLSTQKLSEFKLTDATFQNPYPDLAWILSQFTFETDIGSCTGIFRIIPTADGQWTGFTFYTNLEQLKDYPEKVGPLRNPLPNHGKWLAQREREKEFLDKDPTVLVVGGGQSGLDIGARLKHMDIPTLVVEKNERIGDQWRHRYQALCLHDPVCEYARSTLDAWFLNFSCQGMTICHTSRKCLSFAYAPSLVLMSMRGQVPAHMACLHSRAEACGLARVLRRSARAERLDEVDRSKGGSGCEQRVGRHCRARRRLDASSARQAPRVRARVRGQQPILSKHPWQGRVSGPDLALDSAQYCEGPPGKEGVHRWVRDFRCVSLWSSSEPG